MNTHAPPHWPKRHDLVIGLDGGGTTTVCNLVVAATGKVLGHGSAGPSNIQAVGVDAGLAALDACVLAAFIEAGIPRAEVGAACLGLAGVDRQEGISIIESWSQQTHLTPRLQVANDATLLLAAGTPYGWGLAVIAGTGSIAFVKSLDGRRGRCGGWGYLMGDEGSAYLIALNGLRAACRSYDGILPPTVLVERFVKRMNLTEAPEFIPAVYRGEWNRSVLASLAPVVLEAADEGDAVAQEIVKTEAMELAKTALAAVQANNLPKEHLPIALAGGVLINSARFRQLFLDYLTRKGITEPAVQLVPDPVDGAVVLARRAVSIQA